MQILIIINKLLKPNWVVIYLRNKFERIHISLSECVIYETEKTHVPVLFKKVFKNVIPFFVDCIADSTIYFKVNAKIIIQDVFHFIHHLKNLKYQLIMIDY